MSTVLVSRDVVDLLVSAIYHFRAAGRPPALAGVEALDLAGQMLWDENYRSTMFDTGERVTAPRYQWQPVAEILGSHLLDEQLLQIERCRTAYVDASSAHDDWESSPAFALISTLQAAVSRVLAFYPHSDTTTYAGIERMPAEWTREVGWRVNLTAGTCATTSGIPS